MSSQAEIEKVWPQLNPQGLGVLACAKVAGRMLTRRFETCEGLAKFADRMEPCDIFVHLNGIKPGVERKASSADVQVWNNLLIDIDPKDEESALELQGKVFTTLLEYGLYASCTSIFSGRGFHQWMAFTPMSFEDGDGEARRAVEMACAKFLRSLKHVDTCTSNLDRIARLPGTINTKTGKRATVLQGATSQVQNVAFYSRWQPTDGELLRPVAQITGSWTKMKLIPAITAAAANFITGGATTPGRRGQAYAAAKSIFEAGAPREVGEAYVLEGADKCNPPLEEATTRRAIENAWRKHSAGA